jgi:predicted metal-dependent hydrolase
MIPPRAPQHHWIFLGKKRVQYVLLPSRTAKKLRVRVGPHGVQVVRPTTRPDDDIPPFLRRNEDWLLRELDRAETLHPVIKPPRHGHRTILFCGNVTPVRVARSVSKRGQNKVAHENGEILIAHPAGSRTPPGRSLENWLRKQARAAIQAQLQSILPRVSAAART